MANNNSAPRYLLPDNEPEAERLNFQHKLFLEIFEGLYRAPTDPTKLHRILDVGCGTGNWAIDFAKQYPNAAVFGIDINESPQWKTAPPNCKLWVADLGNETTWAGLEEKFDMIHGRMIVVGVRDWPKLFARCFDHLSPGGWVEMQELQFPVTYEGNAPKSDSKFMEIGEHMEKGMAIVGLNPHIASRFPEILAGVGFARPKLEDFRMILGPWPEDERRQHLGRMGLQNFNMGLRGFTEKLFTGVLGWSAEDYDKFIKEASRELNDGEAQFYVPLKVCFAQKPASSH